MADIEMEQRLVASLEEALETLQKRFSSMLPSSMPATAASDGLMDVRHSTAGSPSSDPQVSTPRTPNPLTTGGARENAREDYVVGNDLVPQMDFPQFDGEDARTWLDKCAAYFTLYNIPEYFRVTAATLHLSGQAAHWFQSCKDVVGILDWDQFKQAVLTEFEVSAHKDKILELLTLKQSGSVEDFRKDFESLVYHIRLYENNLSDTFLVTQFVHGLKHELRALVELQMPESVSNAAWLASKHEKLLGNQSATHLQQGMVGQAIFSGKGADNTLSQGDVRKAEQPKEYIRSNVLCFNCGEKCMHDNKCKIAGQPQLNCISVDESSDGGAVIPDILNLLESSETNSHQQLSFSLNATGSKNSKCVNLRAPIQNQGVLQLLDTGNFHTFISKVKLQGILPTDSDVIEMVTAEQFVKGEKWNVVGALALFDPVTNIEPSKVAVPGFIQEMIQHDKDALQVSCALPLARDYDHTIFLPQSFATENVEPYKLGAFSSHDVNIATYGYIGIPSLAPASVMKHHTKQAVHDLTLLDRTFIRPLPWPSFYSLKDLDYRGMTVILLHWYSYLTAWSSTEMVYILVSRIGALYTLAGLCTACACHIQIDYADSGTDGDQMGVKGLYGQWVLQLVQAPVFVGSGLKFTAVLLVTNQDFIRSTQGTPLIVFRDATSSAVETRPSSLIDNMSIGWSTKHLFCVVSIAMDSGGESMQDTKLSMHLVMETPRLLHPEMSPLLLHLASKHNVVLYTQLFLEENSQTGNPMIVLWISEFACTYYTNEVIHDPPLTCYPELMVHWQKVCTEVILLTQFNDEICDAHHILEDNSGYSWVILALAMGTSVIVQCLDNYLFQLFWPPNVSKKNEEVLWDSAFRCHKGSMFFIVPVELSVGWSNRVAENIKLLSKPAHIDDVVTTIDLQLQWSVLIEIISERWFIGLRASRISWREECQAQAEPEAQATPVYIRT